MRIISIYIFREDGIPLLSRFYDIRAKTVDGLVAPFLVSTTNRMEEITGAEVRGVTLGENTFLFLERFADIICAVVSVGNQNADYALNLVVRRFYKQFHTKISGKGWTGKIDGLDEFIPEMERLLEIEPEMVLVKLPSEILDTFVIADYPQKTHDLLRLLIREDEVEYPQMSQVIPNEDLLENTLDRLLSEGYIGKKEYADGRYAYFRLT